MLHGFPARPCSCCSRLCSPSSLSPLVFEDFVRRLEDFIKDSIKDCSLDSCLWLHAKLGISVFSIKLVLYQVLRLRTALHSSARLVAYWWERQQLLGAALFLLATLSKRRGCGRLVVVLSVGLGTWFADGSFGRGSLAQEVPWVVLRLAWWLFVCRLLLSRLLWRAASIWLRRVVGIIALPLISTVSSTTM